MIGRDTIASVIECINAQSVYNTARTTTPINLGLVIYNQTQDMIVMAGTFRDMVRDVQLVPDADRKVTLPSDFGKALTVYIDESGLGKPSRFYYLNANDVHERYTEEVTIDSTTGVFTRKFVFPSSAYLPVNPHLEYTIVLENATQEDIDTGTKYSFFPKNLMLVGAKKILQDYYGISANQDPNWITSRYREELDAYSKYTTDSNDVLRWELHDSYGNNVAILGAPMDGSGGAYVPYTNPATLMSGGAY